MRALPIYLIHEGTMNNEGYVGDKVKLELASEIRQYSDDSASRTLLELLWFLMIGGRSKRKYSACNRTLGSVFLYIVELLAKAYRSHNDAGFIALIRPSQIALLWHTERSK